MKRLTALVLAIILLFGAHSTRGQADKKECDLSAITTAAKTLSKDNLAAFANLVSETNITCNGFEFTGTGNKIVGPVDIPSGAWLTTMQGDGLLWWTGKILEGNCGQPFDSPNLFENFTQNKIGVGTQIVTAQKGCKLLFEPFVNSGVEWRLTIEPLEVSPTP